MAKINEGVLRKWRDGETVTGAEYFREREIVRTAINDNYDRLTQVYNKADIDALIANHLHDDRYSTKAETTGFIDSLKGAGYTTETLTGLKALIDAVDARVGALDGKYVTTAQLSQEITNALAPKANIADVYTKVETDAKFAAADLPALTAAANEAKAAAAEAQLQADAARQQVDQITLIIGGKTLVNSVNGMSGDVTITFPVVSVNGKTGAAVLTEADVGAAPAIHTHAINDVVGLQAALDAAGSSADLTGHVTADAPHTYGNKFRIVYNPTTNSLDFEVLP